MVVNIISKHITAYWHSEALDIDVSRLSCCFLHDIFAGKDLKLSLMILFCITTFKRQHVSLVLLLRGNRIKIITHSLLTFLLPALPDSNKLGKA